jgi:TPR repeat protein
MLARDKAEAEGTEHQQDMAQYYMAVVGRDVILKNLKSKGSFDNDEALGLVKCDAIFEQKAKKGIGEALFTYGKELYTHIRKQGATIQPKEADQALEFLESAVRKGVSSAYFLTGMMAVEGILAKKDVETGLRLLYKGAAKNNAYCFFYLSMLHHEGIIVDKNPRLEF